MKPNTAAMCYYWASLPTFLVAESGTPKCAKKRSVGGLCRIPMSLQTQSSFASMAAGLKQNFNKVIKIQS
jgi:hypothetical protein